MSDIKKGGDFGLGEENTAFAKYFIGKSYLNPLTDPNKTSLFIANVTFEPACRNNWHIHHAKSGGGQILICVDGEGWYQEEGKDAVSLKPGMVITIPANVKHWHGSKKDSWFSHLAIEVPGEETSNEWCEEVTDEEYENISNSVFSINVGKSDGKPYLIRSWEKYNKMSAEEKAEVDELRKKLYEKFGVDEE